MQDHPLILRNEQQDLYVLLLLNIRLPPRTLLRVTNTPSLIKPQHPEIAMIDAWRNWALH